MWRAALIVALAQPLCAVDYLKMPSGKTVTVLDSQAAQREITAARTSPNVVEIYDVMAGVLIGQHQHAVQHPIGQVSQSPIGQSLYNESGDEIALIVGLERKKSHKVLPFTYLRVSYYGESVPSGTMLFNEKGEVVAFQYVRHDQHETQAYAVPVQAVERAHQDFVTNNFISRCWVGMIVSSSGTVPEIASIRPNSPASKAGLKKGDILAKVGDYTITSYHEAVNAFYYLVAGQTETFEVFRDGELITVELVPVPKNSL